MSSNVFLYEGEPIKYDVRLRPEFIILFQTVSKEYLIDAVLKELDNPLFYDLDVVIKELGNPSLYNLDVVTKKLDTKKFYKINALFKKIDVLSSYLFDTRFVSCITKSYLSDVILKKSNASFGYGIDVMILNALVLDYILEREKIGEAKVTVPDWLSNNPDIDSSIWSKKKSRITLTARIDDTTMLKLIKMKGGLAQIYDGYNTYTAFIVNTEGIWTTDPIRPWTATVDFIVILSDET